MAPSTLNETETIRFLLLCIEKCDTKAINYEEIAAESGLNGRQAAYKRLWDLKNKNKPRDSRGENAAKSPSKVRKPRSVPTTPRKKRASIKAEPKLEEEIEE